MIVADSDVLIDYLRGLEPMRSRIAQEIESGSLAITMIGVFELLSGVRDKSQAENVEQLIAALVLLPLDEAGSRKAASLRRRLEAEGRGLALADCLIAGICLAHSATLLTRNRAHFERVPGLMLGTFS